MCKLDTYYEDQIKNTRTEGGRVPSPAGHWQYIWKLCWHDHPAIANHSKQLKDTHDQFLTTQAHVLLPSKAVSIVTVRERIDETISE